MKMDMLLHANAWGLQFCFGGNRFFYHNSVSLNIDIMNGGNVFYPVGEEKKKLLRKGRMYIFGKNIIECVP